MAVVAEQTSVATPPPWHEPLWQGLAPVLADARVAHAVLICGAPGVGKRVFAQRLARALLCTSRRDNGDACGQCSGCRQFEAETHPDVTRLVPEEAGRMIKVEQVRRFTHALHLTPQYDSGRLGWIDPAEALSIGAANSLLKTIEEPPGQCHIILVTDRVSKLMATVRSRCQIWRVPAPEPDIARAWLAEQMAPGEAGGVMPVTRINDDSLRAPFLVLRRAAAGYDDLVKGWDEDLARLLARRANPVAVAERAEKAPPELWLDWLFRRTNMLLQECLVPGSQPGLGSALQQAAGQLGLTVLEPWSHSVRRAAQRAATNADWRLVVESVLLDLSQRLPASRFATSSN